MGKILGKVTFTTFRVVVKQKRVRFEYTRLIKYGVLQKMGYSKRQGIVGALFLLGSLEAHCGLWNGKGVGASHTLVALLAALGAPQVSATSLLGERSEAISQLNSLKVESIFYETSYQIYHSRLPREIENFSPYSLPQSVRYKYESEDQIKTQEDLRRLQRWIHERFRIPGPQSIISNLNLGSPVLESTTEQEQESIEAIQELKPNPTVNEIVQTLFFGFNFYRSAAYEGEGWRAVAVIRHMSAEQVFQWLVLTNHYGDHDQQRRDHINRVNANLDKAILQRVIEPEILKKIQAMGQLSVSEIMRSFRGGIYSTFKKFPSQYRSTLMSAVQNAYERDQKELPDIDLQEAEKFLEWAESIQETKSSDLQSSHFNDGCQVSPEPFSARLPKSTPNLNEKSSEISEWFRVHEGWLKTPLQTAPELTSVAASSEAWTRELRYYFLRSDINQDLGVWFLARFFPKLAVEQGFPEEKNLVDSWESIRAIQNLHPDSDTSKAVSAIFRKIYPALARYHPERSVEVINQMTDHQIINWFIFNDFPLVPQDSEIHQAYPQVAHAILARILSSAVLDQIIDLRKTTPKQFLDHFKDLGENYAYFPQRLRAAVLFSLKQSHEEFNFDCSATNVLDWMHTVEWLCYMRETQVPWNVIRSVTRIAVGSALGRGVVAAGKWAWSRFYPEPVAQLIPKRQLIIEEDGYQVHSRATSQLVDDLVREQARLCTKKAQALYDRDQAKRKLVLLKEARLAKKPREISADSNSNALEIAHLTSKIEKAEFEDRCGVCLETKAMAKSISYNHRGNPDHSFCTACLEGWGNQPCPMCRRTSCDEDIFQVSRIHSFQGD